MNLKTAAVLIALTLPLAACGNKGPLVLAPKPSPVVEPAPTAEPAAPAEADADAGETPVSADDAPPAAEPTATDSPPPPPPADGTPNG